MAAPDASRPDDRGTVRLARLLLLLTEAPSQPYSKPASLERIGIYDFFADSPLLLFLEDSDEHRTLLRAGFDPRSLSYHSSSQRFTNRRARTQHDLARLLSLGLCNASRDGTKVVYSTTDLGTSTAGHLTSAYADAYRLSARLVARELNRLSDTKLRGRVAELTEARPFVIDLYAESSAGGAS
jgi:hypothetical protein